MIVYSSSLLVLFYTLFQEVSYGIHVNGERRIVNHKEHEGFNVDDINSWMKLDDANFLNTWTKNVSDISFMQSEASKETGNASNTGSAKGTSNSKYSTDWGFMTEQKDDNKPKKPKSNSGESKASSSEGSSNASGKSDSTSSSTPLSEYSTYASGSSSSVGTKEFDKEMRDFIAYHPMDIWVREMGSLEKDYKKVKDDEAKILGEEHNEIEEKRKEERLKMLEESDAQEEKNESEDIDFLKNEHTDTRIKGGFSEFISNLNPFKKELKPLKKEISLATYIPKTIPNKEKIMRDIGITHKYEPYQKSILYSCPHNNYLFNDIESLHKEFAKNKEREAFTNKIVDHNNECLKIFGLLDYELPDNGTKLGNVIGSFGEHHIRSYEIENDLVKYQPDLDYITLADDYKLLQNDINNLENVNFCLLNPTTLENFLKQKEIMDIMGTDRAAYEEKFTKYMGESINCHIESLIYDELDASQDIKIVLKNVKKKLYLLQNGLTYKSKKLIKKIFNEIEKNPDPIIEKLTLIYDNIYHLKRDYTFLAFKTVCDKYVFHYNIHASIQVMTLYLMDYLRYYGACFKSVIVYNAILSGIHEQMKHLMKLIPRNNMLTDAHFEALLHKKNKKITRKDYVLNDYDPSIKAYALTQLERQPMVVVIDGFFEAKKKILSKMIAQMKLDLFSITSEDLKIPKENGKNSKLAAKLISLYKAEIKKFFKEMRADYVFILKERFKGHYKKNYMLYNRLQ
ncbi:rhoptry-associated protein 1 [Plasmodium gonderi]|uniref:Rhoptry-associated protein 1 n=1 Tax=Plasmodium gonderi TaxID=77519 RepID=A0A1Y1JQK2_PLAGO|nr:rhoptry-associated protein 1 [Plasmodium gonderi]GAW83112.1 rhoptry-associated protein 1 [Plasmodium gonderi]